MTIYPSSTWRPISGTSRTKLQKDLFCLHTAVGPGLGTWSYFNRPDVGVYSHFVVCGVWGTDAGKDVDGLALQMADTDYRAAANLDGNWHIISVETADNAARPIQPWTPAQCETLAQLMADANRLDGIPLVLVPDSRQGRRGIAYHRQGCDPYRVAGGELWSSAYGKDCPTQARINQIPGLIDRARAIVASAPQEDDLSQAEALAALQQFFHANDINVPAGQTNNDNFVVTLTSAAQSGFNADNAIRAAIAAVKADTSVTGDREVVALAKLDEILGHLNPTPAP